jgi:tRNA threonylcarbamoyl adenosine modification protein YjeE
MLDLSLPGTASTDALAATLAPRLRAGDVLLLSGPVGAGKTHFARAVILALLDTPEDVPSPTYTLVQVYDGPDCPIWHADLYRLASPAEVIELGLAEAFTTAICLVEWPDRLGDLAPASALDLAFRADAGDDRRNVTLTWTDPGWDDRLKGLEGG